MKILWCLKIIWYSWKFARFFQMLQKVIAQHSLTEMIISHQFWWTNSHFFSALQYGWNTSDYTYNTLDANAARPEWAEQSRDRWRSMCWLQAPGMTAIVCCNLSWHIDCNLVQFGFTLLILHCTVPLSPVDMCVYWWLCGRRASVQLVLHHVNNIVAFGSVVAGLQNCERCLTRWME